MTIRSSALVTAGLLGALFLAGSLIPAHAGNGRDPGKQRPQSAIPGSAVGTIQI